MTTFKSVSLVCFLVLVGALFLWLAFVTNIQIVALLVFLVVVADVLWWVGLRWLHRNVGAKRKRNVVQFAFQLCLVLGASAAGWSIAMRLPPSREDARIISELGFLSEENKAVLLANSRKDNAMFVVATTLVLVGGAASALASRYEEGRPAS